MTEQRRGSRRLGYVACCLAACLGAAVRAEEGRLDRYGDPLPPGATARFGTIRYHHGGYLTGLAYTRDGRRIVTASNDGTLRLWDPGTGKEIGAQKDAPASIWQRRPLAVSPDGKFLATGGLPGEHLQLRDPRTGRPLRQIRGHAEPINGIAFAPDGKQVATSSGDRTIRVCDVDTGRELRRIEDWSEHLAWSPDGNWLAGTGGETAIRLWDATSGKARALPEREDRGYQFTFSPDGKTLAWCSTERDNPLHVVEVATGKERFGIKAPQHPVSALAFGPAGRLAVGSPWGSVLILDTRTARVVHCWDTYGFVEAVAFSPDGHTLVAGNTGGGLVLWDTKTGRRRNPHEGHDSDVAAVALSPDGRVLASGGWDLAIRLWDVAAQKEIGQLAGHVHPVRHLLFTADGRTLISGSFDGTACVWDVASRTRWRSVQLPDKESVHGLALSPDEKLLAAGTVKGLVQVWETATGTLRLELRVPGSVQAEDRRMTSLVFSPDGQSLLCGNCDSLIYRWDVTTGQLRDCWHGHTARVQSIALSPDGRTLASVSDDRTIRLWELATGKERARWSGHNEEVYRLLFGPDGRSLYAASADGTIRCWDVVTGRERGRFANRRVWPLNLALAADGYSLFSSNADGTILRWDTRLLQPP